MNKWHARFINVAKLVSTWSTCIRRQCGAVIVRDKHIISTGYNGAPEGVLECSKGRGCLRQQLNIPSGQNAELCMAVHAEQNALVQAARFGVDVEGASIYIFGGSPCLICAKMMVNAKLRSIYYVGTYPDQRSLELLKEAKMPLHKLG